MRLQKKFKPILALQFQSPASQMINSSNVIPSMTSDEMLEYAEVISDFELHSTIAKKLKKNCLDKVLKWVVLKNKSPLFC